MPGSDAGGGLERYDAACHKDHGQWTGPYNCANDHFHLGSYNDCNNGTDVPLLEMGSPLSDTGSALASWGGQNAAAY